MVDNEKCAHDLAILYMQAQIKGGLLEAKPEGNVFDFLDDYKRRYSEFLNLL